MSTADILRHPAIFRVGATAPPPSHVLPTGFAALDSELAGGGWPRPGLVELLCDSVGAGEMALLLPAHRYLTSVENRAPGGAGMLWIAPPMVPARLPYAPPLAAAGLALKSLTVVNTVRLEDTCWAAEQALLSGAIGMVVVWLDAHAAPHDAALRRLSQAARTGGALCVLMRRLAAQSAASPAELRIALHPEAHGKLSLDLFKRRGLPHGKRICLDTCAIRHLSCLAAHRMPRRIPRERPNVPWLARPGTPALPLTAQAMHLVDDAHAAAVAVRERSFDMDR
jgi:protein ImuA